MGLLAQILGLAVDMAFGVYIGLVWLRFLLQLVRGDFYNPTSQFVVKATNPLLRPLRRVVPSVAGMDTASLVLILLLKMLEVTLLNVLFVGGLMHPLPLLFISIFGLLQAGKSFYLIGIFVYVVLSWVAPGSRAPVAMLIYQIIEPALAPFRRLMPDMGGIDLSPMIAGFCLVAFGMILERAATLAAPLMGY